MSKTWKTYDWTKHETEHYDFAKGNRSYGVVLFYKKEYVLMVQNEEKMWGFPKGHRNDGETEIEAAVREVHEETGVPISEKIVNADLKVTIEFELEVTEEQLNKHIQKQTETGERPGWNKPGTCPKRAIFYICSLIGDECEMEKPNIQKKGHDDGLLDAKWIPLNDAYKLINESGSNQGIIFKKALEKYLA